MTAHDLRRATRAGGTGHDVPTGERSTRSPCPGISPRQGVPPSLLLVAIDSTLTAHLAHAVSAHLGWCRTNAIPPPEAMAAFLAALMAHSGPERPELASEQAGAQSDAVGYEGAAARLGVSVRTVRRMCRDGRLPSVRVGRRVLVPVQALASYVEVRNE